MLEAYAELDVPMTQRLNTNFSVRQTQNEATSSQTAAISGEDTFASWKVAAIYDPLEWLRFRSTVSQDVRAAGFRELFLPRVTTVGFATVNNPWNSGATDTSFAATTGGNPDLEPETADTMTFGAVFSFDRVPLVGRLVRDRLGAMRSRKAPETSRSSTRASRAEALALPAIESRARGRPTSRPSIRVR